MPETIVGKALFGTGGISAAALFGIMMRALYVRLINVEKRVSDDCVSGQLCEEREKNVLGKFDNVNKDLKRGAKKFEVVDKKLDAIQTVQTDHRVALEGIGKDIKTLLERK